MDDDLYEGIPPSEYRRNFLAGLVHGVFFQASNAFSSVNTVLPAFVSTLTASSVAVGILAAAQRVGQILPQLFTAYLIEDRPRKKPWLLAIITFRWISWAAIAVLTSWLAADRPALVLIVLLSLFGAFSIAGGMGTVIYADVFAKAIPTRRRGRFVGWRQLLGFTLAIGAGGIVARILGDPARFPYPGNYAVIFGLAALTLLVAFVGFALIEEPPSRTTRRSPSLRALLERSVHLTRINANFRRLLISRGATESVVAIAPFFVVYALRDLGVGGAAIGGYLAAQMAGAAGSNLLWGWLGDRLGNKTAIVGTSVAALAAPAAALLAPIDVNALFATFALVGAAMSGVRLGYVNFILEMASEELRPTCVALQNTLLAPIAVVPLAIGAAGTLVDLRAVFALAVGMMAVSTIVSLRLRDPRRGAEGACIE